MSLSTNSIVDTLAYQVEAGLTESPSCLSVAMIQANKFCEANDQPKQFADVDIQFQTFIDRMDLIEKERDLIFVTNFFHRVYHILHIDIAIYGNTPTTHDVSLVKQTYASLVRLGKEWTLTDNLCKSIIEQWCI